MRETFPFLKKILNTSQIINSFQIIDFLPYNILLDCSYTVNNKPKQYIRECTIYIISINNVVLTEVPQGTVIADVEIAPNFGGCCIASTESLCHTILQNIGSDIKYIVIVNAHFRIDGFDKKLVNREVVIFEINPNTLKSDCIKAKQAIAIRRAGQRPANLN